MPVAVLGRVIAGLSEAILVRLGERDDLDHVRTTTAHLAQMLSALGQVMADYPDTTKSVAGITGPVVMCPPALLNRAARCLEAAATLVRQDGIVPEDFDPAHADRLADTFDRDAGVLRYHAEGA